MNTPASTISNRDRLTNSVELIERSLLWMTPFVIIAIIAFLFRIMKYGGGWIATSQLVLLAVIALTLLLKVLLNVKLRLLIYIMSFVLYGALGLVQWGLLGQGLSLMVLGIIISTCGDYRYWLLTMIVCVVVVVLVAIGFISGTMTLHMDASQYLGSIVTWVSVLSVFIVTGVAILAWDQVFKQLTQREKDLYESETRYKNLFENSIIGIYRTTTEGDIQMANPALLNMLGFHSLTELKKCNLEQDGFSPSYPRMDFKTSIEKDGRVVGFESIWKKADGTYLNVRENAIGITDDNGHVQYYEGTVEDVSEQKVAQDRLMLFQSALTASSDAISMLTPEGVHWYQNRAFDDMFGFVGADSTTSSFVDAKTGNEIFNSIKKGNPWSDEVEMLNKHNEVIQVLLRAYALKNDSGKILGLVNVHTDITKRKLAEQALIENEKKYSTVVENSNDGIVIHQDGIILYVNPAIINSIGFKHDEIVGKKLIDFIHPDDTNEIVAKVQARLAGKATAGSYEISILNKWGGYIPYEINAAMIDYLGKPAIVVFLRDISERKKAVEMLRQYKRAVEGSLDFIAAVDKNLHFIFANKAFLDRHRITHDKIIGLELSVFFDKDIYVEQIKPAVDKSLNAETNKVEITYNYADLGQRYLEIWNYPLKNEADLIVGVIIIIRDISEQKRANEHIKKSLEEKDVMLKEIHHRVKNNLQIMKSLIYLQSVHKGDVLFKDSATELSSRIQSMASIHELLYRSENMASIYMPTYVDKLVTSILENYSCDRILVNKDVEGIYLDVDHSVPFALLFNELFTNVIKYAFPDKGKGIISLSLKKIGDNIVFKFMDDGVGFPEMLNIDEPQSMGMKLINILSKQLDGKIDLGNNNGAEAVLRFPAGEVNLAPS